MSTNMKLKQNTFLYDVYNIHRDTLHSVYSMKGLKL